MFDAYWRPYIASHTCIVYHVTAPGTVHILYAFVKYIRFQKPGGCVQLFASHILQRQLLTHRLHHAVMLFGKVAGCSCGTGGSHNEQCLASLGRDTIECFQNSCCCTYAVFADTCVLESELLLFAQPSGNKINFHAKQNMSLSERIRKANVNPTS